MIHSAAPRAADDAFVPLAETPEAITSIDRGVARSGYRTFRGADGFEVAVPAHVVERAHAFAQVAAPREWYGLVIARLCEDATGRHAVVVGIVPDEEARTRPGSVETTPESEYASRQRARRLYPDGVIAGWVHSHPRGGIVYSPTDRANQATWTQPHSLGIVVDPWHADGLAVYRGPGAELLETVRGADSTVPTRVDGIVVELRAPPVGAPKRRLSLVAPFVAALALACAAGGVLLVRHEHRMGDRLSALEADFASMRKPIKGATAKAPTPGAGGCGSSQPDGGSAAP